MAEVFESEELIELRKLLFEFEESRVWTYVREDVEREKAKDEELLLNGTDKDDQVRGGIMAMRDILATPDRIRQRIEDLEREGA